jgi:regulator of sigma E protease
VRAIPLGGYVAMAGEEVDDEVVKVGDQVRIVLEGNIVSKIILDHADPDMEQYELITVEKIDLKGVEGNALYINEYEVKRDAFYVIKGRDLQIAPADRNFTYKNKKQRFLAIFGGPFMNFVLAFFVFVLFALLRGFPVQDTAEVGSVSEGMPAYEVLQAGDVITSINGEEVTDWDGISEVLDDNMGDRMIEIVVDRDGSSETLYVTPILYFYSIGFHSDFDAVNDLSIGEVPEGTQAYNAGLVQGDVITKINGVTVNVWEDVIREASKYNDGSNFNITVLRDTEEVTVTIEEPWEQDVIDKQGLVLIDSLIGIGPAYSFNFGSSLVYGVTGTLNSVSMIGDTLSLLFGSSQVGVSDLAGPIGIYQITSNALSDGFISLLGWIGLLSVNLGVINLLPIPALDGGRLTFLGVEAIGDKLGFKISSKIENRLHYVMYLLLLGLFVFITYNDIVRLIESIF